MLQGVSQSLTIRDQNETFMWRHIFSLLCNFLHLPLKQLVLATIRETGYWVRWTMNLVQSDSSYFLMTHADTATERTVVTFWYIYFLPCFVCTHFLSLEKFMCDLPSVSRKCS